MKTRKIPMRMCIVSKEKLPKQELIRGVCSDGKVNIDLTGKQNGKGCYLKKDAEIIETARKKKILNHIFEMDVNNEIYDELLKLL